MGAFALHSRSSVRRSDVAHKHATPVPDDLSTRRRRSRTVHSDIFTVDLYGVVKFLAKT